MFAIFQMDYFPIRQTSEIEKFISAVGKSILNLAKDCLEG